MPNLCISERQKKQVVLFQSLWRSIFNVPQSEMFISSRLAEVCCRAPLSIPIYTDFGENCRKTSGGCWGSEPSSHTTWKIKALQKSICGAEDSRNMQETDGRCADIWNLLPFPVPHLFNFWSILSLHPSIAHLSAHGKKNATPPFRFLWCHAFSASYFDLTHILSGV